jgi:hypothetical protein
MMEARSRLQAAMEAVPEANRDDRWRSRYADIDRCLGDIYGKEASKRDERDADADADADGARSTGATTTCRAGDRDGLYP